MKEKKWEAWEIYQLRKKLGIFQTEFAERIGVHPIQVSRWENGHSTPHELARRALTRLDKQRRGVI